MKRTHSIQALVLLALGYLVDFFDLTLFAAARSQIIQSFHIQGENVFYISRLMFNSQAVGIMIGGLVAGIWGDKIGRMSSVRFGILLYSTAILLSIFTTSINIFIFLRFVAGIGLAGELASSVTFVTEVTHGKTRDWSTSLIYFSGVLGGILATVLSAVVSWKTLFLIGSLSGFSLLFLRLSIHDPLVFYTIKNNRSISKGSLKLLFLKKDSLLRLVSLTCLLVPFWFMVYFINFGVEIARQIGLAKVPKQSVMLALFFIGSVFGTYLFAMLSHFFKSRKKTIFSAFMIMFCTISLFLFGSLLTLWQFYTLITILGVSCGYPGIFTMLAAESFGTNQRTTSTCFVSCFGRGSIILINAFVPWIMGFFEIPLTGILFSNVLIFTLGFSALMSLKETHNCSIDFIEST